MATSNNAISITLPLICLALFELSNIRDFKWLLWHLISKLYSKMYHHQWGLYEACLVHCEDTQWYSDTPACSILSKHHSVILALLFFPHAQIFGDTLPNIFPFWCPADLQPFEQSSTCLSRSILTSVLLIESLPLLESFFTSSCYSLNLLFHSTPFCANVFLSPSTCWSISSACDKVFPIQSKICLFICCCLSFIPQCS